MVKLNVQVSELFDIFVGLLQGEGVNDLEKNILYTPDVTRWN